MIQEQEKILLPLAMDIIRPLRFLGMENTLLFEIHRRQAFRLLILKLILLFLIFVWQQTGVPVMQVSLIRKINLNQLHARVAVFKHVIRLLHMEVLLMITGIYF